MMNTLRELVLDWYFQSQRDLVEVAEVDEVNVIISLPLHVAGGTRVELNVTQLTGEIFLVSDMAQIIGELRQIGIGITGQLRDRIERIGRLARIKIDRDHLVAQYSAQELGVQLHAFAEAAKTIGDAYLVHSARKRKSGPELREQVQETLVRANHLFLENRDIQGAIEKHRIDFYLPPNGKPGIALALLEYPKQLQAEAWAFKSQDIKKATPKLFVGIVYDDTVANDDSRRILSQAIDIPVPATQLGSLPEKMAGFLRR